MRIADGGRVAIAPSRAVGNGLRVCVPLTWGKWPRPTLGVMDAIKTLKRILGGKDPQDDETERPSPAWLARVERRLDEGDVITADEFVRLRAYLADLEPAA
jgi:hypothetical protein